MIGSLVYAGSSMVLTALVNHLIGTEQGGIFGFAFSTFGQQMFLVAYFGMRPLQSTDTSKSYTFSEYRLARLVTCSMAVLFGMGYIIFNTLSPSAGYTAQKALVVFLMVLYKVLDGFADVYESEFQRNGRLYLTGQAMAFRTLLSVFCFLGTLAVTKELIFSCVVAVLSQGAGILLFDKRAAKRVPGIVFTRTPGRQWRLLQDGFLLFLSVFFGRAHFCHGKICGGCPDDCYGQRCFCGNFYADLGHQSGGQLCDTSLFDQYVLSVGGKEF